MKNISLYAASLVALGLGLTACDQLHNDLRLEPPTSYKLDTPANADQLIIFGATGSNVDNQLGVVTYNPYNVNTAMDFQVQVAKNESDFEIWDNKMAEAVANGDTDYNFTDSEGIPYASFVSGIYTSPSFTVPGADFCDAINAVYGIETNEEAEAGPFNVAYRVYAWVPGVEYSFIFSNFVTLAKVQTYIPLREPRKIYLIGQPQGWNIDESNMYLVETDPGSNIYSGTFNIDEGKFQFRFYSALGNWDKNSIGAQDEDNPVDIEFTDDVYFGDVVVYNESAGVLGKGSWQDNAWTGGSIDVELDLNNNTIKMTAHEGEVAPEGPTGKAIYIVGACQSGNGWDINSEELWLQETEEGSNIFENTIAIPAGKFQFKIYTELGDWDANALGSTADGADVNTAITIPYEGSVYPGKGNWQDAEWEGGYVDIVVNLNDMTITMTEVDGPALPEPEPTENGIFIRGGMNDWGTDAAWKFTEVSETEWQLDNVTIEAGVQFKVADANWSAVNLGGPGEEDGVVVTIGEDFTLVGNGKNLVLNENFTGNVTLTLSDDTYTLLLTPAQ